MIDTLYDVLKVGAGAVAVLLIGLYNARNESEKNQGKQQSDFIGHLISRLETVEESQREERKYYEERLKEQALSYEKLVASLESRIKHLEQIACERT